MNNPREYGVREIHQKPGVPQVFAMRNSRDMLAKLKWEIDQLLNETGYPSWNAVAYSAFNCAITAWSLVDWLWEEMSDADKSSFGTSAKFGAYCMSHSSNLEICESLANSGKHRKRLESRFNTSIAVKTSAEVTPFRCGQHGAGDPLATWKWETTVLHHQNEQQAVDIFLGAYNEWVQLIDQYSLEI
jgi:hypothetical protein